MFHVAQLRRSERGIVARKRLDEISDQLAEGLITGREACDGYFDTLAQAIET